MRPLVLLLAAHLLVAADTPERVLRIDGAAATPPAIRLDGSEDGPLAPGDVVLVGGIWLRLDDQPPWDFTVEPGRDLVWRNLANGRELAGASTGSDPLSTFTDAEVRPLCGLAVGLSDQALTTLLPRIDPARCCLNLREPAIDRHDPHPLPALPTTLRALILRQESSTGFDGFASLARCTALECLVVRSWGEQSFDLRTLPASLRVLRLHGPIPAHLEGLARLSGLRLLALDHDGLTALPDLTALTGLRQLVLDRSGLTDLAPALDLPALERLSARQTPVTSLPARPAPTLRHLDLLSTRLDDAQVAAFTARNPACRIVHRWAPLLATAVAGCDRVRVRSGGTCHRTQADERTLVEFQDPDLIHRLGRGMAIDDAGSGFHCMCCGDPSLEYWRGDALLASAGFHHGRSLRWDGWPGDALLETGYRDWLVALLARHGVTGPRDELERHLRAERAAAQTPATAAGTATPGGP